MFETVLHCHIRFGGEDLVVEAMFHYYHKWYNFDFIKNMIL